MTFYNTTDNYDIHDHDAWLPAMTLCFQKIETSYIDKQDRHGITLLNLYNGIHQY